MMAPVLGELIGTFLLVLLGNGVVANVVLSKSKGNNSGWLTIAAGWGGCAIRCRLRRRREQWRAFEPRRKHWASCCRQIFLGRCTGLCYRAIFGAMLGALLVWITYRQHFDQTVDPDAQLAAFCTGPAIRSPVDNLVAEAVGTFVLVFGVMSIASPQASLGALDALPAALLLFAIDLSLGGPTGFAVNPARDLGPRIMHAIMPKSNKRDSDWRYARVPVIGPTPLAGLWLLSCVFSLLK